jgi:hypothetical protein
MKLKVNRGHLVVREIDISENKGSYMLPRESMGTLRTVEIVTASMFSEFKCGDIVLHEKDIMFLAATDFGNNTYYIEEDHVFARKEGDNIVGINENVYLKVDTKERLEIHGVKLDNSFNQFRDDLVNQSGIVAAKPIYATNSYVDNPPKLKVDIEIGDKVWGHHFITHEDNQRDINGEIFSEIKYEELYCRERDGEYKMLNEWNFLEILDKKSERIGTFVVKQKGINNIKGRVKFLNENLSKVGVKVGDIVYFKGSRDYRVFMNGTYYYRVDTRDVICID